MTDVSYTAYFCCGVREEDADSLKPIIDDQFANKLMGDKGREIYSKFSDELYAKGNIISRHKLIDELLIREISLDPELSIIIVGSGLDSRPFRLNGGVWYEIDESQLIHKKNKILPQEDCPNTLTRIGMDFEKEKLASILSGLNIKGKCLFLFEGVLIYLTESQIRETLDAIEKEYPKHALITDIIEESFSSKYSQSFDEKVHKLTHQYRSVENLNEILSSYYSNSERFSVLHKTLSRTWKRILLPLLKLTSPILINGYEVAYFTSSKEDANACSK